MTSIVADQSRLPGPPPAIDAAQRIQLVSERIEQVRRAIRETGSGAAVLDLRRDVTWLTMGGELHVVQGGDHVEAPILITPRDAMVIAPNNEAARVAEEEIQGLPLRLEVVPWFDPDAVSQVVERLAQRPAPLDQASLERRLAPLRGLLSKPEHERMRWLAAVAGVALDGATVAMIPGRTESEVVAALLEPLAAAAIRAPVVLAGADERLRYRHPLPTTQPIAERLMLVLVAERWGLHVAATRMASLTTPETRPHPADASARRVLELMIHATQPGATLGGILQVAIDAYAAEGMPDEWRQHHQGGTIGYRPRERIARPGDLTRLEAGMAVAWNPSVPDGKAEATLLVRDGEPELILA